MKNETGMEPIRVLHVVSGLAVQGGVMAFAETVASASIDGVSQAVWKHRDFRGRDGVRWMCGGVAEATDLGMVHDLGAGIRESVALGQWLRERKSIGERWILHAHSRVGALASTLAGRRVGSPTLVHLHKLSGQPWVYRSLVRWSRARWVFNSQRTRRHHGVPEGASTVVYPPVLWPDTPAGLGPGRIVAGGAFVRVKQFDRLLEAVGRLRAEGCATPVEVFGRSDPPMDREYDRILERLAGNLTGVVLRPYAGGWADTLRGNDVFVHAADREAYGIVVLEAFARGCRVVVPPESIFNELAGDWRAAGGVEAAESTQPDALAAALSRALASTGDAGDRWERRRSTGRRVSLEECVCQLRGLYRSLAGTN